ILLMDKSIKPGDVIAIGQTFGWVKKLNSRYVSLITRDGKEHLIPNELLISERVENWSFSDNNVRIHIPILISYQSDIHLAKQLMLEVIGDHPRILKNPQPTCQLLKFQESGVEFEIRAWIEDPVNGIGSITNDLLTVIWDKFHETGLRFPYPQRDIHLKASHKFLDEIFKRMDAYRDHK
ncbi:MAG: mechanosensitive ion channel, partial [Alphaproteobacteria bacterium]|nr:mechanosensitive ion channel [Alphaproteobacteria bacterium]